MAVSTAPAARATATSTDDATAARHLWHVAIATRPGDDGEDELYAAEATTKGTVLLTIAKTDATMLPIHRGDTVQVGAHEHCVLGAAGGPSALTALGATKPLPRGLAMGAAAHGIGTAQMGSEPEAQPFAAIAMSLVGAASVVAASLPPTRAALRAVAGV